MYSVRFAAKHYTGSLVAALASVLFVGSAGASATLWLRFEDASNLMKDSVSGISVGHLNGSGYGLSSDVMQPQIPLTGHSNTRSLRLTTSSWASITQRTFLFHSGQSTASTLEFSFKTASTGHDESIFWTRSSDLDRNRYNLFLDQGSLVHGDYREPNGGLHPVAATSHSYVPNQWMHVAIVRTAAGASHRYQWYFNGVLHASMTRIDSAPVLPTETTWSLGGRGGLRYGGLIDEVRFSDTALNPDEFLISQVPEPSTLTLIGLAGALIAITLRRRFASV